MNSTYQQFNNLPNCHPDEHIGEWFKQSVFTPNNLQANIIAEESGIDASKLSRFLNGKKDLDNDLAIRLGFRFNISPEFLVSHFAIYKVRKEISKYQRDNQIYNFASNQRLSKFFSVNCPKSSPVKI